MWRAFNRVCPSRGWAPLGRLQPFDQHAESRWRSSLLRGSTGDDEEAKSQRNWRLAVQVPALIFAGGLSYILFGRRFGLDTKKNTIKKSLGVNVSRPPSAASSPSASVELSPEGEEAPRRPKKARIGLRDRQNIGYEDRIRTYSRPDKIFRLFATIRVVADGTETVLMTPQDFVRSILPGRMQPDGLGLDQYTSMDRKRYQQLLRAESRNRDGKLFGQICRAGLLNFSDYLFLLVALSTPRKNFEIAFRMLDMNGDGELQIDEFMRVNTVLSQDTAVGQHHKAVGQSVTKGKSALQTVFFGENGKGVLTYQQFLDYLDQLNKEVLAMEFDSFEPWHGRISELDLADSLLSYSPGMPEQTRKCLRKRVKRAFGVWDQGVTLHEFIQFAQFVACVGSAEWIYQFPPRPMTPEFLQQSAEILAGIKLSRHVANIIHTMFSEKNKEDGTLLKFDTAIFFQVMRQRQNRGLERRGEVSMTGFMSAVLTCGAQVKSELIRTLS